MRQITPPKILTALAGLAVLLLVAMLLPVTTTTGWLTLVVLSMMLSGLLLRSWRRPEQTLSQSIQRETGGDRQPRP